MKAVQIVEYRPGYAKSVAEMWNKSSDSWGGSNIVKTEESVLREHESSSNLHVFLALDGDDVVGYCSFSHYKEDEGALYIPLLNVRTDYHGRKIGKALVLKAVERTVELGWPRLDLYTWAGNTKAVPTYKKCGFFWEKRDATTHLMNFIPTVLQMEALKPYFDKLHWYNDCLRELEIKPDGRKENDFEYYEYLWEKDNTRVRAEFERTGRGLRLIETDDYLISAAVEDHELVYGRKYKVQYELVNKSGKPLHVKVKGRDNKNIEFSMESAAQVTDRHVMEGSFYVGEIIEEQNEWRTCPAVCAEMSINGKTATFSIGIVPKFPAKIQLTVPDQPCFTHVLSECYLTVENNFKEEAVFEFALPADDRITFKQQNYSIGLRAKEKTTIPAAYTLTDYGLYTAKLSVQVKLSTSEPLRFNKEIYGLYKGRTGRFGNEVDYAWMIVNGSYSVTLSKMNNEVSIHHWDKDAYNTWWMYPKLGTPFSAELSKKRPDRVRFHEEEDAMVLQAAYDLQEFRRLELISNVKLYADGIVERSFEIHNHADEETREEMSLSECFYHDLYSGVLPYEGKFIRWNDSSSEEYDNWEIEKLSENWMFSYGDTLTRGICWSPASTMQRNEWYTSINHALGTIPAGGRVHTEKTTIAFGTFRDWHSFRNFARNSQEQEIPPTMTPLEVGINRGNPFVPQQFSVGLKDYRKAYFDGEITVGTESNSLDSVTRSFVASEQMKEASFEITLQKEIPGELVVVDVNFDAAAFQRKSAVFPVTDATIREERTIEQGMEVYSLSNESLRIQASPVFASSLISLEYNGYNWLDHSFPHPHPKSWWNPWTGGIITQAQEISFYSMLQEERSAHFVTLQDSVGNDWRGIRISMPVAQLDKYKGLELHHYYLLLPGASVLCYTTEIVQNTGNVYNHFRTGTWSFLKPDPEIRNSWFKLADHNGETSVFRSGRVKYNLKSDSPLQFGSQRRDDTLLLATDTDASFVEAFANNEVTAAFVVSTMLCKNHSRTFTKPLFYCFTNSYLNRSELKDLLNIRFNSSREVADENY